MIYLYLTFFLTITLFITAILSFKQKKPKNKKARRIELLLNTIHAEKLEEERGDSDKEKATSFYERVFYPFVKGYKKKLPGHKVAKIEQKLLQAGSPFNMSPAEFRLIQLLLLIVFPILFGLYGMLLKNDLSSAILFGLVGFAVSMLLPNFYLKQKAKQRSKQALKELADTVDLLSVSLEAGLGFDAAISKIVEKRDGVLSDEFSRCLEEMRLGKTRREALTGIKERLIVQEVNILISNILQAEKLGIGMVQVLRIQSQDVRERRKQRAEEEAMKAPIKMLFPLVFFIFPSLFIVLLGPAVIQFLEAFN